MGLVKTDGGSPRPARPTEWGRKCCQCGSVASSNVANFQLGYSNWILATRATFSLNGCGNGVGRIRESCRSYETDAKMVGSPRRGDRKCK